MYAVAAGSFATAHGIGTRAVRRWTASSSGSQPPAARGRVVAFQDPGAAERFKPSGVIAAPLARDLQRRTRPSRARTSTTWAAHPKLVQRVGVHENRASSHHRSTRCGDLRYRRAADRVHAARAPRVGTRHPRPGRRGGVRVGGPRAAERAHPSVQQHRDEHRGASRRKPGRTRRRGVRRRRAGRAGPRGGARADAAGRSTLPANTSDGQSWSSSPDTNKTAPAMRSIAGLAARPLLPVAPGAQTRRAPRPGPSGASARRSSGR